jgi:hypothetical protein
VAKEREDNFVNPKQVARLVAAAGKNTEQAQTLLALWAHSDGYIPKEMLEAGKIVFAGSCSYSQLDSFYCFKAGTSKKRVERLCADGLCSKTQTQRGIKFKVLVGIPIPDRTSEVSPYLPPAGNPLAESLVGTEDSLVGIDSGSGRYPDTHSVFSGVRTTGVHSTQQSLRSDKTTSKPTPTPLASPQLPVQPSAPQARVIPPAAPKPPAPKPEPKVMPVLPPNPINTHDWSKSKYACAVCEAERSEINVTHKTCDEVQAEIAETQARDKARAAAAPSRAWEMED